VYHNDKFVDFFHKPVEFIMPSYMDVFRIRALNQRVEGLFQSVDRTCNAMGKNCGKCSNDKKYGEDKNEQSEIYLGNDLTHQVLRNHIGHNGPNRDIRLRSDKNGKKECKKKDPDGQSKLHLFVYEVLFS
jgi:hypothetical protein